MADIFLFFNVRTYPSSPPPTHKVKGVANLRVVDGSAFVSAQRNLLPVQFAH